MVDDRSSWGRKINHSCLKTLRSALHHHCVVHGQGISVLTEVLRHCNTILPGKYIVNLSSVQFEKKKENIMVVGKRKKDTKTLRVLVFI